MLQSRKGGVPMATKKTKDSLLNKLVILGSSFVYLTKDTAEDVIDVLEKNKVLSEKEGKQMAQNIRQEVKTRKDTVKKGVISELRSVINELGIATKEDLEKIKKR